MEDIGLHAGKLGVELGVACLGLGKVLVGLLDLAQVQLVGEASAFQHFGEGLGGVMAGAQAHGAE